MSPQAGASWDVAAIITATGSGLFIQRRLIEPRFIERLFIDGRFIHAVLSKMFFSTTCNQIYLVADGLKFAVIMNGEPTRQSKQIDTLSQNSPRQTFSFVTRLSLSRCLHSRWTNRIIWKKASTFSSGKSKRSVEIDCRGRGACIFYAGPGHFRVRTIRCHLYFCDGYKFVSTNPLILFFAFPLISFSFMAFFVLFTVSHYTAGCFVFTSVHHFAPQHVTGFRSTRFHVIDLLWLLFLWGHLSFLFLPVKSLFTVLSLPYTCVRLNFQRQLAIPLVLVFLSLASGSTYPNLSTGYWCWRSELSCFQM